MELYLQLGHGMMEHCRVLLERWGGGTVILSPRDLEPNQLTRFADSIVGRMGEALVDPQLYEPRANHHRLVKHAYWPQSFQTNMLLGGPPLVQLLEGIRRLNDDAQTRAYILPGVYCERVDDDWLAVQDAVAAEAASVLRDKPRLATICISAESLRFDEQIENLLLATEHWDVSGYYLVAEHPSQEYLVDDPVWLSNLLILAAGLKLQGRSVTVGYCSHQMLVLGAANVDAIASGSWLNVRCFTCDKFWEDEEDSTSRRVRWYYCPQALSEFKIPFLDLAWRAGILDALAPDELLGSDWASTLFSGAQPSSTAYTEQDSFRHYLQCLWAQSRLVRAPSFAEALAVQRQMLDRADEVIRAAHRNGVRGQDRDFGELVDVNRSALTALESARGFVLSRQW